MPIILAALTVAVQIFFIVHVFRTGRPYWWAFIILSMPVLGSVIYYMVEVFPGSRQERNARKAVRGLVKTMNPDADLKKRAEELEICGSVDNKLALAEECEQSGMPEEAVKLYQSALSGPYAKDAKIRYQLARALLAYPTIAGHAERTQELVRAIQADSPDFRSNELRLLEARAVHAAGQPQAAAAIYEKLVPIAVGLEAKTRYGLLLKELGHARQAHEIFEGVVTHARRFNIQHAEERAWADTAQRELGR